MARVKRGVHSKKKHKAVMDRAKGFRGARSRRFKVAKEAVMHAERYAYRDRRARKGDFRKLWITRINAAARMDGLSYSRFMHGLKLAEVTVDRKNLADMAVREPEGFSALVAVARSALGEVDTASGGPTAADAPTRSSADVVDNVADTDTVGAVESDEIVDDASGPVESDDEPEASSDTDEAEVTENVLVETAEHDEVDLTEDEPATSDQAADAADVADPEDVEAANVVESPDADEVAVDVDQEVEAVDASDDDAVDDAADAAADDEVSLAEDDTVDSDADGEVNADDESPFGEGSATADDDGAGPEGWTVKGNADSMLYHTEESPYYGRTKAEVWFETEHAASDAGFERWDHQAPADDDVEVVEADEESDDEE